MQTIQPGDTVMFTPKNDLHNFAGVRTVKHVWIVIGTSLTNSSDPANIVDVYSLGLECGNITMQAFAGEWKKFKTQSFMTEVLQIIMFGGLMLMLDKIADLLSEIIKLLKK